MSEPVTDLIQDITGLVSFPAVGLRVNEMVNDPSTTAAQLGAVISRDPALTAQLLQIANSAAFGHSAQIDTVSRAVTVLGTRQIRDIVLAGAAMHAFEGIPNELVSMEDFWRHSLYCGLAARFLAERRGLRNTETLFIAGMLHDVGQLVIFRKLPRESKQALLLSIEGDEDFALHHAEQRILGFDHAQVGAALLRRWNFPSLLVECTEFHHAPALARQFPLEAALVHIANSIAQLAEVDSVQEDDALLTEPAAWGTAGLEKDIIERAVRAAQAQFGDVRGMFM
ncbi:MAG: HDOD domain-containing protein [Gammaproteobacteria bacterium]|nr:HDOD domain-containing protein [Gammaproteobacteria bacterium]